MSKASRPAELLGLGKPPIAIGFFESPPPGVPRWEGGAVAAGCVFWEKAMGGQTFYTVPSDHYNCAVGSYTHRIALPAERAHELNDTIVFMAQNNYVATAEVPGIPTLDRSPGAVAYGPLDGAGFKPDVVLIAAKPAQAMLIYANIQLALGILHQRARGHPHHCRAHDLSERHAPQCESWLRLDRLPLAGARHWRLADDADRGENLDWFSSTEIVIEAGIAMTAFYMFIVHMTTSDDPFIDPKIFTDRNFSIGLIAIFIVGIILLATMALLTPFLQQVLDYPVLTAGLVMAPRGIGTMVAMMIVGRIITRIAAASSSPSVLRSSPSPCGR